MAMSGKLLIIDPDVTGRIALRVRLQTGLFTLMQADTANEALNILRQHLCVGLTKAPLPYGMADQSSSSLPDAILLKPPIYDMTLKRFCIQLHEIANQIPVFVLQSRNDPRQRLRLLQLGIEDVMPSQVCDRMLFARLRAALRQRPCRQEQEVANAAQNALATDWSYHHRHKHAFDLAVEDRSILSADSLAETHAPYHAPPDADGGLVPRNPPLPEQIFLLHPSLSVARSWCLRLNRNRAKLRAGTPKAIHRLYQKHGPPSVIVLGMPSGLCHDTLSLLSALRADPKLRGAAILAVADPALSEVGDPNTAMHCDPSRISQPQTVTQTLTAALDLGVQDILLPEADPQELSFKATRLLNRKRCKQHQIGQLKAGLQAAVTDSLTGLTNRRGAITRLRAMITQPLTLSILDIDHFKQVNDTYGHAVGDDILVQLAQRLRRALPPEALVARIGGEEFLVARPLAPAQPDNSSQNALQQAQQLRQSIAGLAFDIAEDEAINITVSLGLALLSNAPCSSDLASLDETLDGLIQTADKALYRAKATGRNRVSFNF